MRSLCVSPALTTTKKFKNFATILLKATQYLSALQTIDHFIQYLMNLIQFGAESKLDWFNLWIEFLNSYSPNAKKSKWKSLLFNMQSKISWLLNGNNKNSIYHSCCHKWFTKIYSVNERAKEVKRKERRKRKYTNENEINRQIRKWPDLQKVLNMNCIHS